MKNFFIFYFFFINTVNGFLNNIIPYGEKAIGNWKLLYTNNPSFYQMNIEKKEIINCDKKFILYDNEFNKIELNIYPDYEDQEHYQNINKTFPKLFLVIKKYEKQNLITYSKIIKCNLFINLTCEDNFNLEEINETYEDKQCSLVIVKSEKMIKSIGMFEFPHITFLYKSAMNPIYSITWKIDTILNRLYVYFDKSTYVFEREFYDVLIMKKQSITTNTFIVTNIISFIMCKLLEKIFDGK
jgi:hypothetical protein